MENDDQIILPGGGKSSQCPPYELIPSEALDALALRLGKGVRTKGDASWNGLSKNRETALTKEFVLNRLGHLLKHTALAIDRVSGRIAPDSAEDADGGDAGAILWAGAMLAAYEKLTKKPVGDVGAWRCLTCGGMFYSDKDALSHLTQTHPIMNRI